MIPQSVQVFQVENAKLQHLHCREIGVHLSKEREGDMLHCEEIERKMIPATIKTMNSKLSFCDEENLGTPRLWPEVIKQRNPYYCTLVLR